MKCIRSVERSLFVAFVFVVLALGGTISAHASSWGAAQTVNNWKYINGRYTTNNELETYASKCVWYEGSTLVIKSYFDGTTYWSGRVESVNAYGYGSYKFTANLTWGKGLLPAVWACCLNPWLPEIDAAEIPFNNGQVFQTFHDWQDHQTQWNKPGNYAGSFHTYEFVWLPDRIDYYIDGTFTGTAWYSINSNVGMHVIVNTAIGGNWPGNPDSTTWNTPDGARYTKCSAITYTPYYP